MEKKTAVELLIQEVDKIPYLKTLPYDNDEFRLWLKNVENIINKGLEAEDKNKYREASQFLTYIRYEEDLKQQDYINEIVRYEIALKSIVQRYEILGISQKPTEKTDRQRAIELLEQKSNEAVYVASLPYNNNEYLPWRRNIEDILEATFGVTSTEYKRVADSRVDIITTGTQESIQQGYKAVVHRIQQEVGSIIQKYQILELDTNHETHVTDKQRGKMDRQIDELLVKSSNSNWKDINTEYGVTKRSFGKRINFVKDSFKRTVIYRDVEQAFILASSGFSKPAVILAGGVIEELLRLYLEHKQIKPISNNFDGYIQTCEQKGVLKAGISRLSDSARHFRNLVHLSKEETKSHTISKSTAKGAVAAIFTIANDF